MRHDPLREFETESRATAAIAWAISSDAYWSAEAVTTFKQKGWARYADDLEGIRRKAGVSVMASTDDGVAEAPLNSAFWSLVERQSILGALEGALRVPLNVATRVQVGTVTATAVAEGGLKPVARMTFDVNTTDPTKVVGEVVVSDEFLRTTNTVAQRAVSRQLVSATAVATDAELVSTLTADAATGTDVSALFAAVSDGAPANPILIGGLDTLLDLADQLAGFRSLGIVIVPSAAAAGKLIALDGSGLLIGGGDDATIATARHATILMDDGGSPPGTTTLSLFQRNVSAIRAERSFKFAVRDGAVAWGAPS